MWSKERSRSLCGGSALEHEWDLYKPVTLSSKLHWCTLEQRLMSLTHAMLLIFWGRIPFLIFCFLVFLVSDLQVNEISHYSPADFEPALTLLASFLWPEQGDTYKPLLLLGNGASELIDLVIRQAKPG